MQSPTPDQIALVRKMIPGLGTGVDRDGIHLSLTAMKLRRLKAKLSRLNFTKAARDAAALKAQFRREDAEALRQGRGAELVARNRKLLGIAEGARRGRLVGFGGVRFE